MKHPPKKPVQLFAPYLSEEDETDVTLDDDTLSCIRFLFPEPEDDDERVVMLEGDELLGMINWLNLVQAGDDMISLKLPDDVAAQFADILEPGRCIEFDVELDFSLEVDHRPYDCSREDIEWSTKRQHDADLLRAARDGSFDAPEANVEDMLAKMFAALGTGDLVTPEANDGGMPPVEDADADADADADDEAVEEEHHA